MQQVDFCQAGRLISVETGQFWWKQNVLYLVGFVLYLCLLQWWKIELTDTRRGAAFWSSSESVKCQRKTPYLYKRCLTAVRVFYMVLNDLVRPVFGLTQVDDGIWRSENLFPGAKESQRPVLVIVEEHFEAQLHKFCGRRQGRLQGILFPVGGSSVKFATLNWRLYSPDGYADEQILTAKLFKS
jgi:hypothetical protein